MVILCLQSDLDYIKLSPVFIRTDHWISIKVTLSRLYFLNHAQNLSAPLAVSVDSIGHNVTWPCHFWWNSGGICLSDDLFLVHYKLVNFCLLGSNNLPLQEVGRLIKVFGSWDIVLTTIHFLSVFEVLWCFHSFVFIGLSLPIWFRYVWRDGQLFSWKQEIIR